MAKLSQDDIWNSLVVDEICSFGPFASIGGDQYLFETRPREIPIWLGYNANPLFGLAQFYETWIGRWTPQLEPVRRSYQRLLEKTARTFGQPFSASTHDDRAANHHGNDHSGTPASAIYHYICLSVLDQFEDQHRMVADSIDREFHRLVNQYGDLISDRYLNAARFEFGFRLRGGKEATQRFCRAAFRAGILCATGLVDSQAATDHEVTSFGVSSDDRLLFQLNLAYRENFLEMFWRRLHWLMQHFPEHDTCLEPTELGPLADNQALYDFHRILIESKLWGRLPGGCDATTFLSNRLDKLALPLVPVVLNRANYRDHRNKILAMQAEVYEPVRQTPAEEFDILFDSQNPLSLLLLDGDRIAAMGFAGRLALFTRERGVLSDPFVDDSKTYYSVDLTIAEPYRGGLGLVLKQALVLLAIEHGVAAIHGRNRDRLARGMWAINLSLGSYELQHLKNDYPDRLPHRDCIYYRCPLQWCNRFPRREDDRTIDVDLQSRRIMSSLCNMVHGRLLTTSILEPT